MDNPKQVQGAARAAFSLNQSTPVELKGDAMHGIKRVVDAANNSMTDLSLRKSHSSIASCALLMLVFVVHMSCLAYVPQFL